MGNPGLTCILEQNYGIDSVLEYNTGIEPLLCHKTLYLRHNTHYWNWMCARIEFRIDPVLEKNVEQDPQGFPVGSTIYVNNTAKSIIPHSS